MDNCLVIQRGTTEVYRFPFSQIVYIEAINHENWCSVCMVGPEKENYNPLSLPLLLGDVWKLILAQIDQHHAIFRCGRSLIVNPAYIRLIDVSEKRLVLADGNNYYVFNPSREALIELKTLIIK